MITCRPAPWLRQDGRSPSQIIQVRVDQHTLITRPAATRPRDALAVINNQIVAH